MIEVTDELLESAKTVNGGYTGAQVRYGQKLTECGQWKSALLGMKIQPEAWSEFVALRKMRRRKGNKSINRAQQLESALSLLTNTAIAAIKAGDWQVDGACDPTFYIERALELIPQTDIEFMDAL